MTYYDRTATSEGIYVNKRNQYKECDGCHYCFSLDKSFKFQTYFRNGSHDLSFM